MIKTKNKKIIAAMSGGVDSSVSAALLKRAGFEVIGVFMRFWTDSRNDNSPVRSNKCCSPDSMRKARKVAKILKVPFYVVDARKEFKERIVDYFLKEHKQGRTPNPCVVCNKEIKFGLLLEKALALEADIIATGHYARIETQNHKKSASYKLLKGKDKTKDQSYFLWQLNQNQLSHIRFPVGEYTKKEVKQMAQKFNFPTSNVSESQEICFVQDTVNNFLKKHLPLKPGKIVTEKGKALGHHKGLPLYTIGQRKGIGLSGGPFYVLDKDQKQNKLIVTKNEKKLYQSKISLKNTNWVSEKPPKTPTNVKAKIRYRHQATPCIINKASNKTCSFQFKKPQRAITPGQSAVFYKGKELLGGGIIC